VQFTTSISDALASTEARRPDPLGQSPTLPVGAPETTRRVRLASPSRDIDLSRPLLAVATIGIVAAAAALAVFGRNRGLGVAIGAALATANLWAFARIGAAVLRRPGAGVPWALLAPIKLGLLFAAVVAVLKADLAGPIDFLVGYLALPVGIVLAQLLGGRSEFENQRSF
jgi:hypothetical protein